MVLHLGPGIAALLEHVLHQVDAPTRRIALIPEQHVGRARRRAQAAMHEASQDAVGFRQARFLELLGCEVRLHCSAACHGAPGAIRVGPYTPHASAYMRPGFKIPAGANTDFRPRLISATRCSSGWNTSTAARTAGAARMSVA